MSKIIRLDIACLGELHGPVVALAPQDRDQVGDLAPDSPAWVWRPIDASHDRASWWKGSDYEGRPVPDFIVLAPAAPIKALAWMAAVAIEGSTDRILEMEPLDALEELEDGEVVVAWLKESGVDAKAITALEGSMPDDATRAQVRANAAVGPGLESIRARTLELMGYVARLNADSLGATAAGHTDLAAMIEAALQVANSLADTAQSELLKAGGVEPDFAADDPRSNGYIAARLDEGCASEADVRVFCR